MTTVTVALAALALCHAGVLGSVLAGGLAAAVPSLGLVCVLVVARRAPPGRIRIVAVLAGLVSGALLEGGLLSVPVLYLLLAALARSTRLIVPLETWWALAGLGVLFAGLEAAGLGLVVRQPAAPGSALPVVGVLLTGVAFALAEVLTARSPSLRHAIERP